MARKRYTRNPSHNLTSQDKDEEDKQAASQENDVVEERVEEEESPAKKFVVFHKHRSSSDSEDDSDCTIPSPNVSDFQIKPVINKSSDTPTNKPIGSKRSAPTAASESMKKKQKEERIDDEEAPIIVLGLPRQTVSEKKWASRSGVRRKVNVNRQPLELDKGKETIDGKSKKLLQKMLELYIKKTELVEEQTTLLLEELKSEKV